MNESPVTLDVVSARLDTDAAPVLADPRCSNERTGVSGGAAAGCAGRPVGVTRGERVDGASVDLPEVGHIDWLALTIPPVKGRDWRWLRAELGEVFGIGGECWNGKVRKWSGYQNRVDLVHPGDSGERVNLGLVAWGGESQRGTLHVSLNGQACARVVDWDRVKAWGEAVKASITRVDVAHDDFEGRTVTIETALHWYRKGGFTNSGRPPAAELIDDLGSGKGRTFYVGHRQHGKLCRVYEKGKKEGDPASPWVRVEVEWRNKNRAIPWEILTTPGTYLAGAYPCLEYLSEKQDKIRTLRQAGSINYACMVENLRNACGRGLNAMLHVEQGDAAAVVTQLVRDGFPKRLEPFADMESILEGIPYEDVES